MQVLHQRLNKANATSLAALIFDLIESAKLQPGATHGLGFSHSRPHIFVDLSLEVKTQLVIELDLCGRVPQQATQPEE
jgi:hypothetical protein